eukprot:3084435-Pyramimonas_sp.AAC.1
MIGLAQDAFQGFERFALPPPLPPPPLPPPHHAPIPPPRTRERHRPPKSARNQQVGYREPARTEVNDQRVEPTAWAVGREDDEEKRWRYFILATDKQWAQKYP